MRLSLQQLWQLLTQEHKGVLCGHYDEQGFWHFDDANIQIALV